VTELGKKVVRAEAERMKGLLDEAWEMGLLSAKG
jgi:hypothetical protein